MSKLFVNLGNSLVPSDRPGILAEAQEKFGVDREVVVIAFEGDRLLREVKLPEEATLLLVKEDGTPTQKVSVGPKDVFVLNGGMTPQQAAMIIHLSRGCTVGQVVNMQRERCVVMASCQEAKDRWIPAWQNNYNCQVCHDGHFFAPWVELTQAEADEALAKKTIVYSCPYCGHEYTLDSFEKRE